MTPIQSRPLSAAAFAPFGQVIQKEGVYNYPINDGNCARFHDLAQVETKGSGARAMISIFTAKPFKFPLTLYMVERHPLGSQAFYPLSSNSWVVIVCADENGVPATPQAFIAAHNQGVNIGCNVWHAVLTPLEVTADFLVVDRGGEGVNLQEHFFAAPYTITDHR